MFPRALSIITWNVLHRVHAVNWKEPCIEAFPEEKDRNSGIAERVTAWLANGDADAVCLQEVSGDQLSSLRAAAPKGAHVFEHVYPRLPRLRRPDCATLSDTTEYLAVLTRIDAARPARAETFASDPGKGFLSIALDHHVLLVDTHVSYGPRAPAQLALLGEVARATPHAIVVGDYNAPRDMLARAFGDDFALSDLAGQITRVPHGISIGKTIDHVVVRGGVITAASVLDGAGLSDHLPVRATVSF